MYCTAENRRRNVKRKRKANLQQVAMKGVRLRKVMIMEAMKG
jgi:hypothetical protein